MQSYALRAEVPGKIHAESELVPVSKFTFAELIGDTSQDEKLDRHLEREIKEILSRYIDLKLVSLSGLVDVSLPEADVLEKLTATVKLLGSCPGGSSAEEIVRIVARNLDLALASQNMQAPSKLR